MWEKLVEAFFAFLKQVLPGIVWDKVQLRIHDAEKGKAEAELKGEYEKNRADVLATANESDAVDEVINGTRPDAGTKKKPL